MNIELMTGLSLVVSLLALLFLRQTDPKRRRIYHLPKWDKKRFSKLAWLVSLTPGPILLIVEAYAPFIMWFAAYSFLGWVIALPKPAAESNKLN